MPLPRRQDLICDRLSGRTINPKLAGNRTSRPLAQGEGLSAVEIKTRDDEVSSGAALACGNPALAGAFFADLINLNCGTLRVRHYCKAGALTFRAVTLRRIDDRFFHLTSFKRGYRLLGSGPRVRAASPLTVRRKRASCGPWLRSHRSRIFPWASHF